MHERIKLGLICALIALGTTACSTVRYNKMVGVHFSNQGPGTIPAIKVTSGNCTWPLWQLEAAKEGSAGITLYCTPSQELNVRWQAAQGEQRELNLTIHSPIEQSVIGWRLQFANGALTVWQEEERDSRLFTPQSTRQIYP